MLCPASMSGSATEIHSFWQHSQSWESSAIRLWTTASLVVAVWWLFKRNQDPEMLAGIARFHGGPWMCSLSPAVQPDWTKGHCLEFPAGTKPNSASLGQFPMDEHFFLRYIECRANGKFFLINNSGEQIVYPGTAQSEWEPTFPAKKPSRWSGERNLQAWQETWLSTIHSALRFSAKNIDSETSALFCQLAWQLLSTGKWI